ncbi:hypothetical protein Poli38472_007784 [Pythium oligandrum]|uniref:PH domain-containing protein n=1 Tax=Pythium oligandrum TaxID=41045 RepID=A0A8K1CST9_PYTOL|nr:hypothetical protein Poli38472_007784 [Pythium oligandrum]|eukprot:TMW68112.1 hypothetical protein Poli38472_007784 [Pythium oligandrum]
MLAFNPEVALTAQTARPPRRWSISGTTDAQGPLASAIASVRRQTSSPTPTPTPPPPPPVEQAREKRQRRRSVDMSPLQSSLKKTPTALTAKLANIIDPKKIKDALHWGNQNQLYNNDPHQHAKERRVHFPVVDHLLQQEFDRPETTEEEKACYHYSKLELLEMVVNAKRAQAQEPGYDEKSDDTIIEQGYLTFPNEHHFFHQKRYYCLLKARQIICYSSPVHAAKNVHLKWRFPIIKVQDCAAMSMQAKITAFGAHLPSNIGQLFFVTKANGERVLVCAETKRAKRHWVHAITKLTQVHECPFPICPPSLRQKTSSSSSTSTCTSEDDNDGQSPDDETREKLKRAIMKCNQQNDRESAYSHPELPRAVDDLMVHLVA